MLDVGRTQGQGQSNKVASGSPGQTETEHWNFRANSLKTSWLSGEIIPETDL